MSLKILKKLEKVQGIFNKVNLKQLKIFMKNFWKNLNKFKIYIEKVQHKPLYNLLSENVKIKEKI